jgi:hypothetical protein
MKPYRAKSLTGAEAMVRKLRKQIAERNDLIDIWNQERLILAKLAADTPQFYNPFDVIEAKQIRDKILLK